MVALTAGKTGPASAGDGPAPAGLVGLPVERLALPAGEGVLDLVLCTAYMEVVESLTGVPAGGTAAFELPAWNRWYWVGNWCEGDLVFTCWLRHTLEE